jgi:hypothetical protein
LWRYSVRFWSIARGWKEDALTRISKIPGIGSVGLIALVIVLSIGVVLIGCQNTTSSESTSSEPTSSEPTSEITQSASSSPSPLEPAVINLSGNGQKVTEQVKSEPFNLESGLVIFRMSHQGSQNFIVHLLDKNGAPVADPRSGILANTIGPFQGSQAVEAKAAQYAIDVKADGPWTVTVEQPRPTSAEAITSFNGNSTTATDFFQLSSGLKQFEMSHQGSQNFIVRLLDKNGAPVRNLVNGTLANAIGPFNGAKSVRIPKDDIYLLQVEANGPWTIEIT